MTAPKLRFKEFDGDWLPYVLKDFVSFRKGKGISKADISEDGINECIRYGELYTTYGQVIRKVQSKTYVSKSECVLSQAGDVLIPASGETQIDIATASGVLKGDVILSGDLNILSHKENGEWLAYYLSSAKKLDIAQLAQGNSVVHLYSSQLKDLKINKPSKAEQTKIASFLSAVDEKISQLTKKHQLLSQYKQGMMQKLFSQQLRFKADDGREFGEWEDKPLNEIASKRSGKNKDGSISEVLTNSATQGIIKQSDYFEREIVTESNLNGYYIVNLDDFVYNPRISVHAPVGPIKRNKKCLGVMSPLYTVFTVSEGNLAYLEYFFDSNFWHDYVKGVANSGARHDRMNITNKDFFDMPIFYPCLEEQTKIANFLSSIDQKIEVVAQQIEQAKTWKKGLLQQMFV